MSSVESPSSAEPRARRRLIGGVLVGLSLASLIAVWVPLDDDPSTMDDADADAAARAAGYRDQAAAGQASAEGAWKPWFESLATVDGTLRVGERFLHPPLADRAMVDSGWEALADRDPPTGPLATLVDFGAQLEQRGIDFLVLPIPPLATVYPRSTASGAPRGEDLPWLDWRLRRLYAQLEEHGIEVLDLLPSLRQPPRGAIEVAGLDAVDDGLDESLPTSVDLMFRLQDRHWTPRASGLAASLLATRIHRYAWFDEVARTMGRAMVDDRWFVESVRGPLAERLIRVGELPADHPPEVVLRRVARPLGEESSFTDRGSPILVVGDSFAGPEYGLLDGLLVELGFRVDFVILRGALASQQLDVLRLRGDELAGKRLVIWQFTAASIGTPEVWRPVSVIPVESADS